MGHRHDTMEAPAWACPWSARSWKPMDRYWMYNQWREKVRFLNSRCWPYPDPRGNMDSKTLSSLHDVFKEVQKQHDWKAALDKLFGSLRGDFVFDNVVIYFMEPAVKSM